MTYCLNLTIPCCSFELRSDWLLFYFTRVFFFTSRNETKQPFYRHFVVFFTYEKVKQLRNLFGTISLVNVSQNTSNSFCTKGAAILRYFLPMLGNKRL